MIINRVKLHSHLASLNLHQNVLNKKIRLNFIENFEIQKKFPISIINSECQ